MLELVTKTGFNEGLARLRNDFDNRLQLLQARLDGRMDARFAGLEQRFAGFDRRFAVIEQRLKHLEDNVMLKLTVRVGVMLAAFASLIVGALRFLP